MTGSFLIYESLAANNNGPEFNFWIQLLVMVLLAASWSIYSLVKKKTHKFRELQNSYLKNPAASENTKQWHKKLQDKFFYGLKNVTSPYTSDKPVSKPNSLAISRKDALITREIQTSTDDKKPLIQAVSQRKRDLQSGMELLEVDFLLSIVENTENSSEKQTTMRDLSFAELIRRGRLSVIDSRALQAYALNKDKLYAKELQAEAMKELTERTKHKDSAGGSHAKL